VGLLGRDPAAGPRERGPRIRLETRLDPLYQAAMRNCGVRTAEIMRSGLEIPISRTGCANSCASVDRLALLAPSAAPRSCRGSGRVVSKATVQDRYDMKAIVQDRYGAPGVPQCKEVERPVRSAGLREVSAGGRRSSPRRRGEAPGCPLGQVIVITMLAQTRGPARVCDRLRCRLA
jgi:hypothetical protein